MFMIGKGNNAPVPDPECPKARSSTPKDPNIVSNEQYARIFVIVTNPGYSCHRHYDKWVKNCRVSMSSQHPDATEDS